MGRHLQDDVSSEKILCILTEAANIYSPQNNYIYSISIQHACKHMWFTNFKGSKYIYKYYVGFN